MTRKDFITNQKYWSGNGIRFARRFIGLLSYCWAVSCKYRPTTQNWQTDSMWRLPSMLFYLRQGGGYVVRSVCLSVMSVCKQNYCKSNRPIPLKLGVMRLGLPFGRTGLLVVIRSRIRITDHFSSSLTSVESVIFTTLRHLLAFLIQSPADFHDSRRNDLCWQGNESTTFL